MLRSIFVFSLSLVIFGQASAQSAFITVKDTRFFIGDHPYSFLGVNMWYAGILGSSQDGKQRLVRELDFLQKQGVTNIRVLGMAEGVGVINGNYRVTPAFLPAKYSINERLLGAFDFFLAEMGKRNMKAVIYLSNNWEWSGGFMQYLNWFGKLSDTDMRNKMEWERMRDVIAQFYLCDSCRSFYFNAVTHFIRRKNAITGISYTSDPSIMAWEIANEPRPMRPSAIEAYKSFIHEAASLIKTIDKHHLVTTGSEGPIGSETAATFATVHADPLIDYATVHVWPKNWQWFSDTSISKSMDAVKANTLAYLRENDSITQTLHKPLVLEEFGMPRDGELLTSTSSYTHRLAYFHFMGQEIFGKARRFKTIQGANFWAMGGEVIPNPEQSKWHPGDPLMGDPPFEPQGLNAVFESDTDIWNWVKQMNAKLVSIK